MITQKTKVYKNKKIQKRLFFNKKRQKTSKNALKNGENRQK
jgi:hypothetical protein